VWIQARCRAHDKIAARVGRNFSVGYTEQTYSELPFARTVSTTFTPGIMKSSSVKTIFLDAAHLIWHEDEPIVWPSSVSLYFVARLAANA